MRGTERLRELLSSAGLQCSSVATAKLFSGSPLGHEAMHELLLSCGAVTLFDTEGDFNVDGNHAAVLVAVARRAGLDDVSATDRWISGLGRLMHMRAGANSFYFLARSNGSSAGEPDNVERDGDEPSDDWVLHELLYDGLNALASLRDLAAISVGGFDQHMSLGLLPPRVAHAMEAEGLCVSAEVMMTDQIMAGGQSVGLDDLEAGAEILMADWVRGERTSEIAEEHALSLRASQ